MPWRNLIDEQAAPPYGQGSARGAVMLMQLGFETSLFDSSLQGIAGRRPYPSFRSIHNYQFANERPVFPFRLDAAQTCRVSRAHGRSNAAGSTFLKTP